MKKALEKFAADILNGKYYGNTGSRKYIKQGGWYYITNGYAILRLSEPINDYSLDNVVDPSRVEKIFNKYEKFDFLLADNSPTTDELRNGIKYVAGRKYGINVVFNDEFLPALNARILLAAMESLHAKNIYYGKENRYTSQIYIFQDDDFSKSAFTLFPIVCDKENNPRFYEG